MTVFAQSHSIRDLIEVLVERVNLFSGISCYQHREFDNVMRLEVDGFAVTRMSTTPKAGVFVSRKDRIAPLGILGSSTNFVLYSSGTVAPVPMFLAGFVFAVASCDSGPIFVCVLIVFIEKSRNLLLVEVVEFDDDRQATAALAEVLSLVFCYPLGTSLVMSLRVVTSVVALDGVALGELSAFVPLEWHQMDRIRFNGDLQAKSGELLETLTEGNQQPSQGYTPGRFRDYRSGTARLITGISARRESDEIVQACQ